jgi:hypothetical protein
VTTTTDPSGTSTSGATDVSTGDTATSGAPKFDLDEPPVPDLGDDSGPIIPETCDQALAGESTVGCLFYAVDMDAHDAAETSQYAVAVANVQQADMASVLVEQKVGGVWQTVAGPQNIPALSLFTFQLPDKHTDDTELAVGGAYRLTSDLPVIAYQFSPVDGSSSFLSDASMLFPVPALDTLNQVTGWIAAPDNGATNQYGYATIIGTLDGTQVTVTPKVATQAGAGIPAGAAGTPFNLQLGEGDVASIAVAAVGTSMTGTRIDADKPVAVLSGHECALIPNPVCCCDHLEEQIAGVRLWGTNFIAGRMPIRNTANPETSLWQIYASEDATTVTLTVDPGITGIPANQFVLNQGQVSEMFVTGPVGEEGDFQISADKPINVFNYMTGSENMPAPLNETGDPAMVQLSPVEQFLPRYVVLVPGTWINDVAVITRPAGAPITIDGVAVADSEFFPVGASGYEVARASIPDGVHVLKGGSAAFGVVIVGYDTWDSYAYLGGTGTGVINPNPEG